MSNNDFMDRAENAAASMGRSLSSGVRNAGGGLDMTDSTNQSVFQNWLQTNKGNYGVSDDDMCSAFNNWCQHTAQPGQVEEATANALRSMPKAEQRGFMEQLLGLFNQNGIDPQNAGVSTTDPNRMSPDDAGRLVGYAQQQRPDILQQLSGLMSNPMVQMALAGILGYVANQFLGGRGGQQLGGYPSQGYPQSSFPTQGYPQSSYPTQGYPQDQGGGFGFDLPSLIGLFTGGGRRTQ